MAQAGDGTPGGYPTLEGRAFNLPICRAVEYVRKVVGDNDAEQCFPVTRQAIRQAAFDGRISIYGRRELPPPKRSSHHSDIWYLIEPIYWERHEIGPMATDEEWQAHEHTRPEPLVVDGYRERYWSLLVHLDEIVSAFPQPRQSDLDEIPGYPGGLTWIDRAYDPHFAGQSGEREDRSTRAPSVKAGRPPTDEEIVAKAREMKARGLIGRTIASTMRHEPGFENVATTAVRDLIKGLWKPGGRPKKSAQ